MKRVLITGVSGQDGSFLAELLVDRGYQVFGMVRRLSFPNYHRLEKCLTHPLFTLVEGDVCDLHSMIQVVQHTKPDWVFNLASQSFVMTSWNQPMLTMQSTGVGAVNVFEACRLFAAPHVKIYQASSSEMFGLQPQNQFQHEKTPLYPRSPYACAKTYAHHMAINYRESYGMFIVSGILFNHESERRGENFVTRKISKAVANIVQGKQHSVSLGNIDIERDWGFAGDYVDAMVRMLEQDTPQDYVIATGQRTSLRYFLEKAFSFVQLDYREFVQIDQRFMRPVDVPSLCGDASKAHLQLQWKPSIHIDQLIERMVEFDLEDVR